MDVGVGVDMDVEIGWCGLCSGMWMSCDVINLDIKLVCIYSTRHSPLRAERNARSRAGGKRKSYLSSAGCGCGVREERTTYALGTANSG